MSEKAQGEGCLTILLVEDEPLIALTITDILEELGHRVLECASASKALELAQSEPQIDLLITDIGLPDMQGDALAREIRAGRPDLPVLISTGRMAGTVPSLDGLGGAVEHLTKPFLMHDLQSAIERLTAGGR